jgi:hypothetical protein
MLVKYIDRVLLFLVFGVTPYCLIGAIVAKVIEVTHPYRLNDFTMLWYMLTWPWRL